MSNSNGSSNRTIVLTVYSDGTITAAAAMTAGEALQIAETIRQAVLSHPIVSPPPPVMMSQESILEPA